MDKLEIKQGSFIQQTQYFIPDSRSGGMETNVFPDRNWFLPDLSLGPACLGISDIWMVVLSNYFYSLHFVEINSSMFQLYVCKVYFVFHFRFMEKKVCCKFFSSIYLKQFIIYILAWCHTLYPKWLVTNKNMDI
jgi:hypothetical protein